MFNIKTVFATRDLQVFYIKTVFETHVLQVFYINTACETHGFYMYTCLMSVLLQNSV